MSVPSGTASGILSSPAGILLYVLDSTHGGKLNMTAWARRREEKEAEEKEKEKAER